MNWSRNGSIIGALGIALALTLAAPLTASAHDDLDVSITSINDGAHITGLVLKTADVFTFAFADVYDITGLSTQPVDNTGESGDTSAMPPDALEVACSCPHGEPGHFLSEHASHVASLGDDDDHHVDVSSQMSRQPDKPGEDIGERANYSMTEDTRNPNAATADWLQRLTCSA